MSRTSWILLALLLASNALWWLGQNGQKWQELGLREDRAELRVKAERLEQEVARLRGDGPSLEGAEWERARRLSGGGADAQRDEPVDSAVDVPPGAPVDQPIEAPVASVESAANAEAAAAYAAARGVVQEILRKIRQVQDADIRQAGLDELAAALAGSDPYLVEYALSTLHAIRDVPFDHGVFAALVGPLLDSENGGIRRSALYAMAAVDPEHLDRDRLLRTAADPDERVRSHTARLLAETGEKRFVGAEADTLLALLADESPMVRRGTLRGLSGAEVTPELEARLIEMAAGSSERDEALTYGLRPLPHKSRQVVDALLVHLGDQDPRARGQAHQGLQQGVGDGDKLHIARAYVAKLGTFTRPGSHAEALKLIVRYGDASLAGDLERFAGNDLLDKDVRALALQAAEYLATRKR